MSAVLDSEVETTRQELAALDSEIADKRDQQRAIDSAVAKAAQLKDAGDFAGAVAAEMEAAHLRQKFGPADVIGKLSGQRTNLINNFVATGPDAPRIAEIKAFNELFETLFFFRLKNGGDYRADMALKVAGEIRGQLTREQNELQQKRRDELPGE